MTSTTWDSLWEMDDSMQQDFSDVHYKLLSNQTNEKAQNREGAEIVKQKSTATIWGKTALL